MTRHILIEKRLEKVGNGHMYGKAFESMYSGSMVGAGSPFFAVWGYVIAKMKPDEAVGAQVELNPELLGFILGEKPAVVEAVIKKMCSPDAKSRTKDEEGRRLVKLGEFDYRVVNGPKYLAIRTEEERREAARVRKAESRSRKTKAQVRAENAGREKRFVDAVNNGQEDKASDIAAENLPGV